MIGGVYLITILRAYIHYSVVLHTYTIFETAVVTWHPDKPHRCRGVTFLTSVIAADSSTG